MEGNDGTGRARGARNTRIRGIPLRQEIHDTADRPEPLAGLCDLAGFLLRTGHCLLPGVDAGRANPAPLSSLFFWIVPRPIQKSTSFGPKETNYLEIVQNWYKFGLARVV
ncbi:hypothetical protein [Maritimibacter sp. 55A14]|uniref:hypothetical protein n=1 Tax=Maritimibacter sp. 55A14 TaxID=2174844 RepID=UPI0011B1F078|nr:hypothetical protein [Maritimibacter sp. 55A14]